MAFGGCALKGGEVLARGDGERVWSPSHDKEHAIIAGSSLA